MSHSQRSSCCLILILVAMTSASDGMAYSSGPPDGVAGEPPAFQTCINCHDNFPLNSGDGLLQLLDAPTSITPGQTYTLTVELEDPGQSRWGFELTVLNDQLESSGTIVVTDPVRTQLSDHPAPALDYLKHTSQGTAAGTPGPTQWSFDWIAGVDTEVDFYLAGNAANNDGGFFGDYIYAIQVTAGGTTAVLAGEVPVRQPGVILAQNQPNPFNPSTSIPYTLDADVHVTLRIIDSQGRVVRHLLDRSHVAGDYAVSWSGVDDRGLQVPSGVYFYRLEAGEHVSTRKMILAK